MIWNAWSAAREEAARLGSSYVGPEHFLLALLRHDQETVAAHALRDSGADYEALSTALLRALSEQRNEREQHGPTTNPVAHELVGRAEGIAAGVGADAVTAEHVLLGLLWSDREWSLTLAGTTREAVYERLRASGVSLPGKLPPSRTRPSGPEQLVYFPQEQLRDVLARLPKLLPADAEWGWNLDGAYRAWVRATGDFDLRERVSQALDGAPA